MQGNESDEFLEHLHSEKLKAQEMRASYVVQKLGFVTALLGAGSLKLSDLDLSFVLYIVPFVALAFDLYVLGEDYSVKRIGAFLGANSQTRLERVWEAWVSQRRDMFQPIAMPLLTLLTLAGAAWALGLQGATASPGFWGWVVAAVLLTGGFSAFYSRLRGRLRGTGTSRALPRQVARAVYRLAAEAEEAEHVLTDRLYYGIKDLCLLVCADPSRLKGLQQVAPAYTTAEFLACVDAAGGYTRPSARTLADFRDTARLAPAFNDWFREEIGPDGKPTLLVARWLCHLLGLRHLAVGLVLDHPTLDDQALVQIRGMNKQEYPGSFDLPVAGHVAGFDSPRASVLRELTEELGLGECDVCELGAIDRYPFTDPHNTELYRNVEYRIVYRGRLQAESMLKVKSANPEVAALAVIRLAALESLAQNHPERVASALAETLKRRREAHPTTISTAADRTP